MAAELLDLYIEKGSDLLVQTTVSWNINDPVSLEVYDFRASIVTQDETFELVATEGVSGGVELSLGSDRTDDMQIGKHKWFFEMYTGSSVRKLIQGDVFVDGVE